MTEKKFFKYFILSSLPFSLFFAFFLVLLCSNSSGDDEIMVVVDGNFCPPIYQTEFCESYYSQNLYSVTSPFGTRVDPFDSSKTSFHSGIDLGAPAGTPVVASADGIVVEVGYNERGLGNYVYIKHDIDIGTIYTVYGHMLDESIIVFKDQFVVGGETIGLVGSTGLSTGNHLHFMLMKDKISFKENDLIDPKNIIYGLN